MKASFLVIVVYLSVVTYGQGNSCSNPYQIPVDTICRNYPVSATIGSCIYCTMNGYNGNNGRITYFSFTTDDQVRCVLIDVTAAAGVTLELVLYNGCLTGVPMPVGGLYNHNMCMSEGSGLWAQNLFDNLAPNTTYYLKARTAGGFTGDLQVCARYYSPPNMDCMGATSISSNVFVKDNNACHRPGTIPPTQLCAITLENTAWYTYVVQASGSSTITIDSIQCNNGNGNNNNGFQIGFFSGTCNSLIPITCSNGAGGTVQATATGLTGGTRIYVAIDGYSGSNCSYSINATNAYPLPVKLKHFAAWKDGSRNKLKWISLTEENNSYYEVQRSEDGKNYSEIGRIAGDRLSTSEKEYIFFDDYPPALCYYRLKQVDLDGKYSFSNVVEVRRNELLSFNLFPVVISSGELNLKIQSQAEGKALYTIYSYGGALIKKGWLSLNKGINISPVDISPLAGGSYIIEISMDIYKTSRGFNKF